MKTPKIVWPTFAYDPERLHVGPDVTMRPPFRKVWTSGGASLLEFPPVIGYGRLFLADGAGRVLAVSTKTGKSSSSTPRWMARARCSSLSRITEASWIDSSSGPLHSGHRTHAANRFQMSIRSFESPRAQRLRFSSLS